MGCTVSKKHTSVKPETISLNKSIRKNASVEDKQQPEVEAYKMRTASLTADDRIQLTSRQKFQILTSLKGIERAVSVTGVKMFLGLFQANKDLVKLFGKLAEYKVDELDNCPSLEGHSSTVMNMIDEAISSLDDTDYVIKMLHCIGKLHKKKLKDFDPNQFWKIEEPFLNAVRDTLGDRYTANMENLYKITIRFILETMIEGYNT